MIGLARLAAVGDGSAEGCASTLDRGAQPLGLMVARMVSLVIVIELAAHQIAGLILDAGEPRRPGARVRR